MKPHDVPYENASRNVNLGTKTITAGGVACFYNCISLFDISLPVLTTAGDSCFVGCTSLSVIDISNCDYLGSTVGDDSVFSGIINCTITLTIKSALMTCNEGQPDGDIQYLTDVAQGNTVTIIQV